MINETTTPTKDPVAVKITCTPKWMLWDAKYEIFVGETLIGNGSIKKGGGGALELEPGDYELSKRHGKYHQVFEITITSGSPNSLELTYIRSEGYWTCSSNTLDKYFRWQMR